MTTAMQQRPMRGSRISAFYPVKSLPSLSSLDSAFQLQEYISLLIRLDMHDVETIVSLPGSGAHAKSGSAKEGEREKEEGSSEDKEAGGDKPVESMPDADAEKDKKADGPTVDEACWIYEQLRRLAQDLSHPLITMLQQECTRATCPEMKAGEWLYLCVAHGTEGAMEQCCAIDYILHTVDSATALLNSPRAFPSRLQIPQTSHRHFSSLARRLGRIFAHAYFHHRETFEQAEAESSLYARFLALTAKFDLVPPEFLVIPPQQQQQQTHAEQPHMPRLLGSFVAPLHFQQQRAQQQQQQQQQQPPTQPSTAPQADAPELSLLPAGHWDHRRGSVVGPSEGAGSPGNGNGSGIGGESPRKYGRNRTDTMVQFNQTYRAEPAHDAAPPPPPQQQQPQPQTQPQPRQPQGPIQILQRKPAEAETTATTETSITSASAAVATTRMPVSEHAHPLTLPLPTETPSSAAPAPSLGPDASAPDVEAEMEEEAPPTARPRLIESASVEGEAEQEQPSSSSSPPPSPPLPQQQQQQSEAPAEAPAEVEPEGQSDQIQVRDAFEEQPMPEAEQEAALVPPEADEVAQVESSAEEAQAQTEPVRVSAVEQEDVVDKAEAAAESESESESGEGAASAADGDEVQASASLAEEEKGVQETLELQEQREESTEQVVTEAKIPAAPI